MSGAARGLRSNVCGSAPGGSRASTSTRPPPTLRAMSAKISRLGATRMRWPAPSGATARPADQVVVMAACAETVVQAAVLHEHAADDVQVLEQLHRPEYGRPA